MFFENKNFFHLNYVFQKNLLSSSEFYISSELQIMNKANVWLSYNYDKRSKFAKKIFLATNLSLLSESVF